MYKNEKGLTLPELVLVIFVIGLLAVVINIAWSNARSSSRDKRRKIDLNNIKSALTMYYDEQSVHQYPNAASYDTGRNSLKVALEPKYLQTVPDDPKFNGIMNNWNCAGGDHDWAYFYRTTDPFPSQHFRLFTFLEKSNDPDHGHMKDSPGGGACVGVGYYGLSDNGEASNF